MRVARLVPGRVVGRRAIADANQDARNTAEQPDRVTPASPDGKARQGSLSRAFA